MLVMLLYCHSRWIGGDHACTANLNACRLFLPAPQGTQGWAKHIRLGKALCCMLRHLRKKKVIAKFRPLEATGRDCGTSEQSWSITVSLSAASTAVTTTGRQKITMGSEYRHHCSACCSSRFSGSQAQARCECVTCARLKGAWL